MKTLAIIYGASSSGKTTFTNKLKGKCAVLNTDELYTVSVSRDYTMASGARGTDIKRVESNGIVTHQSKFDLVEKLLELNSDVVIEGKRFFDDYFLRNITRLCQQGVKVKIAVVVYAPELCQQKMEKTGKTLADYFLREDVARYECHTRFVNVYNRLSESTDFETGLFDVSSYKDWKKVEKFLALTQSKQVTDKQVQAVVGSVDLLQAQSDGVSDILRVHEILGVKSATSVKEEVKKEEVKRTPVVKQKESCTSLDLSKLRDSKAEVDLEIRRLRKRIGEGENIEHLLLQKRKERRKIRNLINSAGGV